MACFTHGLIQIERFPSSDSYLILDVNKTDIFITVLYKVLNIIRYLNKETLKLKVIRLMTVSEKWFRNAFLIGIQGTFLKFL